MSELEKRPVRRFKPPAKVESSGIEKRPVQRFKFPAMVDFSKYNAAAETISEASKILLKLS